MKKYKLTFKQQVIVCFAVFIINIILAHTFQSGWFHNLSWLIYGVLLIVNPVLPEQWCNAKAYPKSATIGCRIAGAICVYIGATGQFGI